MKKYEFVRFKSLVNGEESKKWWLVVDTPRMVIDHAAKFLKPAMQEGFDLSASAAIQAVFKHGDVSLMPHPANMAAAAIQQISSINYQDSPMAFFHTANMMLKDAIDSRLKRIEKGKTIYLEDGVREFGYNENDPHFEIVERCYMDEMTFPDFKTPTFDDVKFIQWPGGSHWYAKVNREDIVDKDGNQKWNTRYEAEKAAEWYIEKYY